MSRSGSVLERETMLWLTLFMGLALIGGGIRPGGTNPRAFGGVSFGGGREAIVPRGGPGKQELRTRPASRSGGLRPQSRGADDPSTTHPPVVTV